MKKFLAAVAGLAVALFLCASGALAYTFRARGAAIPVTGSGVSTTQALSVSVVSQNTADTASELSFGIAGNTFRDSGEALKISVDTNLAANRVIIYTDNLGAGANPHFCRDTALGNDGGGLVGATDCSQTVPLLWAINDANIDHTFTTAAVGDDEVYVTDMAHVATYVDAALPTATAAERQKLDTLPMKFCATGVAVSNPDNAGTLNDPERYPQHFGSDGAERDLCNAGADITIAGTFIAANAKVSFAEELSKNIAVVLYNCLGGSCTAPNLGTPSPADSISVTSPVYVAIGADFRSAQGQNYATTTLTVDLVTQ